MVFEIYLFSVTLLCKLKMSLLTVFCALLITYVMCDHVLVERIRNLKRELAVEQHFLRELCCQESQTQRTHTEQIWTLRNGYCEFECSFLPVSVLSFQSLSAIQEP